jgi:MerR family mercuric resistance operon transcriptional regulator
MNDPVTMGIGEFARQTGCNIETIRYYERIGVLPRAARTAGRYRMYGDDDVRRLRFVRRARELGFGLEEVRLLLTFTTEADGSCAEVRTMAVRHLDLVRTKIADLRRIEEFLDRFVRQCRPETGERCAILEALLVEEAWPGRVGQEPCGSGDCCDDGPATGRHDKPS